MNEVLVLIKENGEYKRGVGMYANVSSRLYAWFFQEGEIRIIPSEPEPEHFPEIKEVYLWAIPKVEPKRLKPKVKYVTMKGSKPQGVYGSPETAQLSLKGHSGTVHKVEEEPKLIRWEDG